MTDSHYLRPQAAYDLLKKGQTANQTVYLYAPTGSGKTMLIRDYLAHEDYQYYSSATAGPSEIVLPEKVNRAQRRIVVMDDLQEINTDTLREQYLPLIREMDERADIWLVLAARCPVSKWLRPLSVRHPFIIISSRQLWFTRREQDAYLEKWGIRAGDRFRAELLRRSSGHPLVLAIAARELAQDGVPEAEVFGRTQLELWDYLETYIYEQWEPEMLDFLMDLTVVKEFDLDLARLITHKNDAARLIGQAIETGDFLWEQRRDGVTVYRLGKVLQESLRRRLERTRGAEHVRELYNSAGSGYELAGRTLDALNLYKRCGNNEAISRILIENARKNVGDGSYYALREYYLELPEDVIRRSADLMSAMSLLQAILMNVEESERWYGELRAYAERQTGGQQRYAQMQLLYLDIALPQRGSEQVPELLRRMETAVKERRRSVRELAITADLPSLLNGAKDFCEWTRRDREILEEMRGLFETTLEKYGKGLVNLALAESLLEKGADSREISLLVTRGKMQAQGGKPELLFVAAAIPFWISLFNDHAEDAYYILNSFTRIAASAPWLMPNVEALRCRLEMYKGSAESVRDWLPSAPDENSAFCTIESFRYMTKVRAYLVTGRYDPALWLLQQMICYAEEMGRTYLNIEANVLLSIVQYRLGYRDWVVTLQTAVTMAEDYHFVRVLSREGAGLWELLRAREFRWTDTAFRDQVIGECRRMAENYPSYLKESVTKDVQLPERAIKILKLQSEGMSVDKIAAVMSLSKAGVKYYNQESYKKLGVNSKAAAVAEAQKRGLI